MFPADGISISPDYEPPDDSQEDDSDFHIASTQRPLLYSTDWTAGTAVNQIARHIIDLNPRFQRRDAWSGSDKSKFIESLALSIPIPQIILAEHPSRAGKYIVIDGKQRLLTLVQFITTKKDMPTEYTKLRLSGLLERSDLNGKYFEDIINSPDGLAVENAVIRTVIISGVHDENFLYEVFLRLNTQSKKLSPQELRQALAPGPFTELLDDVASGSKQIQRALNIKGPDRRMRDNELLLRFIAFKTDLSGYTGNFKIFLDGTTKHLNKTWEAERPRIENLISDLDSAIETTFQVFGREAFQVFEGEFYTGRFNRAVFDIMVFFFSDKNIRRAALEKAPNVQRAFEEACTNEAVFRNVLSVNTKDTENVYTRFSVWGGALKKVIGATLPTFTLLKTGRITIS